MRPEHEDKENTFFFHHPEKRISYLQLHILWPIKQPPPVHDEGSQDNTDDLWYLHTYTYEDVEIVELHKDCTPPPVIQSQIFIKVKVHNLVSH